MATIHVHVSEETLAELEAEAAAEGKTVDELAEDALRRHIDRQTLERFKREANQRRRGMTDAQVDEIVDRAIREVRGR
jgi:Ribbon-helix-helix protein, copG family/Protein of unknown function (DUF2800)